MKYAGAGGAAWHVVGRSGVCLLLRSGGEAEDSRVDSRCGAFGVFRSDGDYHNGTLQELKENLQEARGGRPRISGRSKL